MDSNKFNKIKKISSDTSRVINSQQYIYDSYIIAKELIENSIDADATHVKIIFDIDSIIIEDNGTGIEDLNNVCQPWYTSKEGTSYSVLGIDLKNKKYTHGFRGQALSAIKELCNVIIITNTSFENDIGLKKDFLTGIVEKIPRKRGTTIKVTKLFQKCLLRKKTNEANYKKNAVRLINYVKMLCYINNINLVIVSKGKIVFVEQGSNDSRTYSIDKHGTTFLEVNDELFNFFLFPLAKEKLQNIIANKRIVTNRRIKNLINNIFKKRYDYIPTFILIIYDEADVNISVDKTEVIFKNLNFIENKLKAELELYFSHQIHFNKIISKPINKLKVKTIKNENNDYNKINEDNILNYNDDKILKQINNDSKVFNHNILESNNISNNYILNFKNDIENKNNSIIKDTFDNSTDLTNDYNLINNSVINSSFNNYKDNFLFNDSNILSENYTKFLKLYEKNNDIKGDSIENINNMINDKKDLNISNKLFKNNKNNSYLIDENNEIKENNIVIEKNIKDNLYLLNKAYKYIKKEQLEYSDVIIKKEDFRNMKIIGQFNKGFILCEFEKNTSKYLITVDQHAADEIFHFEELVDKFYFKKQDLITPINLELSAEMQFILEEYQNILEKNGFIVKDNKLLTIPVYKGYFFGITDFYLLLNNISQGFFELKKIRDLMASKACRTSIMIGDSLNERSMRNILNNLSRLKQPWNCPHGRPTFKIITKL